MATEALVEKKPEAEAPAEDGDGVGDSGKAVSRESDEAEEKDEAEEEEDDGESEEEKTGQKGSSGRNKSAENEPVTPLSDRPTRTRKQVERYSLPTPSRSSGSKSVLIVKGRGTILRDIPNVAYKLSKRKPDDNLLLLHTILYGKKAKPQMLKKNIGQFSGFVWSEKEEEKQRTRVKEKLEKCIKEKLIDFCNVLDIPVNKSNVKKEELSGKVLEFLECPKATRDVLLADRENRAKKRNVTPTDNSEVATKRKRQPKTPGEKRNQPSETNDSHEEALKKESDGVDSETEDEAEEKTSSDKDTSSKKAVKEGSGTKHADKAEDTQGKSSKCRTTKPTSLLAKKQKVENEGEKDQRDSSEGKGKKRSSKSQAKGSKDQGQEKSGRKGEAEPTRKEMFAVVARILKEVDFDTATLSDILRKLGGHFGVDLMHRKAEVKEIITEAMKEMTDDTESGSDIESGDED